MSIYLQFINVIVRKATLDDRYPGGVAAYARDCPNRTFYADDHLTHVGFMNPWDTEAFVDRLEARGLRFLDERERCVDLAVVEALFGFTRRCDWIEVGRCAGSRCCWLRGFPPGELVLPPWFRRLATV